MASENSEMEVDGIDNDSKYTFVLCTTMIFIIFHQKKEELPFFSTLHFDEIFKLQHQIF